MSKYLLSVVCPITQMAGRLNHVQAWLSKLAFLEAQVILVHDKRDEETSEQLKLLMVDQDPRKVLLIEGQYGSAGAARNQGLAYADAEWVCFWDSDDDPEVENIFQAIQASSMSEIIIGQFKILHNSESGNIKKIIPKETLQVFDLVRNPGLWRFVFRRKIIRDQIFPSFPLGEDQAFLAQIPWGTVRLRFVHDTFYVYRSGAPLQLTSNKLLVPQLEASVQFLANLPKLDRVQSSLIDAMIFRQSVTMLRFLSVADPMRFFLSLVSVLKFVLKSPHRVELLGYGLKKLIF